VRSTIGVLLLLPVLSVGAAAWNWGFKKTLPADPKTQADAARLSGAWTKQGRTPALPPPLILNKGVTLWGAVVRGGVPKGGLTTSTPAGTKFYVETTGFVGADDRRVIANHSRLYGEVVEAWSYQSEPYRPARLKLWFYKLEDKAEGKTFPVQAIVTKTDGLDVTSGGTILGARRVALGAGWGFNVTILKDVPLYLERNIRGVGVWGHWVDGEGFHVTDVAPGRAAADAGIEVGDVFTEIDGRKPGEDTSAMDLLDGEAGTTVKLKVVRGRLKPFKVTLERGLMFWDGLGISWLRQDRGFQITWIAKGSDLESSKIPVGTVFLAVNGKPLDRLSDAEFQQMLSLPAGAKVEVTFRLPQAAEPKKTTFTAHRFRRTLPR